MPPAGGQQGHHSSGACGQTRGCSRRREQRPAGKTALWASEAAPTSSKAVPARRAGGRRAAISPGARWAHPTPRAQTGVEARNTKPAGREPPVSKNKPVTSTHHYLPFPLLQKEKLRPSPTSQPWETDSPPRTSCSTSQRRSVQNRKTV